MKREEIELAIEAIANRQAQHDAENSMSAWLCGVVLVLAVGWLLLLSIAVAKGR